MLIFFMILFYKINVGMGNNVDPAQRFIQEQSDLALTCLCIGQLPYLNK